MAIITDASSNVEFERHCSSDAITQLRKIRSALWKNNGRPSKISLMVGAGMSRNASALHPNKSAMDWKGLTQILLNELCSNDDAKTQLQKDCGSVAEGYMRIAQYYQSKFGRHELDKLIAEQTADREFEPGTLHKKLLNLPWREVFTTNWDTLLERASEGTDTRPYFPVVRDADLLTAGTSRITKLHGCVDRHPEFTFTEEDYRTYAHKHPGFVTAVRQALLDGPLCLVGFSGDDPNFRAWIGWIKDSLGAGHQIILLELQQSINADFELRRLHDQGVSKIFLGRSDASVSDTFLALLEYLDQTGKSWPKIMHSESWQAVKSTYPGWGICPHRDREELCRRLEQTRADDHSVRELASRCYFLKLVGTGPDKDELNLLDQLPAVSSSIPDEDQGAFSELLLYRMEEARLSADFEKFEMIRAILESRKNFPMYKAQSELSVILAKLMQFKFSDAIGALREFDSNDPNNFLRAIALCVEQNNHYGAEASIEKLSNQLRNLLHANPDDETFKFMRVLVDWLSYRLKFTRRIEQNRLFEPVDVDISKKIRPFAPPECDLYSELTILEHMTNGTASKVKNWKRAYARGFAPHTEIQAVKTNEKEFEFVKSAYLAARILDDVGLLVTGPNFVASDHILLLKQSARVLLQNDPPNGVGVLRRLISVGGHKEVAELLSRETVWALPLNLISALWRDSFEGLIAEPPLLKQASALLCALRVVLRLDAINAQKQLDFLFKLRAEDREDFKSYKKHAMQACMHVLGESYFAELIASQIREFLVAPEENIARDLLLKTEELLDLRPTGNPISLDASTVVKFEEAVRIATDSWADLLFDMAKVLCDLTELPESIYALLARRVWNSPRAPDTILSVRYCTGYMEQAITALEDRIRSQTSPLEVLKWARFFKPIAARNDATVVSLQISADVCQCIFDACLNPAMSSPIKEDDFFSALLAPRLKIWREAVCSFVAPRNPEILRSFVESDQINPSGPTVITLQVFVALYCAGCVSVEQLEAKLYCQTRDDYEIALACSELLQELPESDARIRTLAFQLLSEQMSQNARIAAQAMLCACTRVSNVTDEQLLNWLHLSIRNAEISLADDSRDSNQRFASARLFCKLILRQPDLLSNSLALKTLDSFRKDGLPEVRNEVAMIDAKRPLTT